MHNGEGRERKERDVKSDDAAPPFAPPLYLLLLLPPPFSLCTPTEGNGAELEEGVAETDRP